MRFIAFLVLCLGLLSPASAAWKEAATPHFLIYSEGSDKTLRDFAIKVERFDSLLRARYKFVGEEPSTRLTIFVLADAEEVQKTIFDRKSGRNIAGYYLPRAAGSMAVVNKTSGVPDDDAYEGRLYEGGDIILFHEYTHHFMHRYFPVAYPAWYIEGFAEFFATVTFADDGRARVGLPARHRAYGLLDGPRISAETLFSATPGGLSLETGDAYYGRAWLLVHYLDRADARRGQLQAYLAAINSGQSSLEAARAAFGDFKQLDKELDKYVIGRFAYTTQQQPTPVTDTIIIRPLSDIESDLVPLRLRFMGGIGADERPNILKNLTRHVAKFPASVDGWYMLAHTLFEGDESAAATTALERALALDPKHARALLLKAQIRMSQLRASKSTSEDEWKAVRMMIGAANRSNVKDPMPLLLYYDSWVARGLEPNETAFKGLQGAYLLAPEDRSVALRYAIALAKKRRFDEAIRLVEPVAFDPHASDSANNARQLLARLKEAKAAKPDAPPIDVSDLSDLLE